MDFFQFFENFSLKKQHQIHVFFLILSLDEPLFSWVILAISKWYGGQDIVRVGLLILFAGASSAVTFSEKQPDDVFWTCSLSLHFKSVFLSFVAYPFNSRVPYCALEDSGGQEATLRIYHHISKQFLLIFFVILALQIYHIWFLLLRA